MHRIRKDFYPLVFNLLFLGLLLYPLRGGLDFSGLNDDFYGRSRLIEAVSNVRFLVGDRVFPKVLIGKDNWLIYTAENSINDYQNAIPFSESQLSQFQRDLDFLQQSLEQKGIKLLVVIPPNKNTIYPEHVPDEIPVLGRESRLDQLLRYMAEHGQTRILDLRPALLTEKAQRQVYYALDTHWNDFGSFTAYREIAIALAQDFPAVHPLSEADYHLAAPKQDDNRDLAQNIGGVTLLQESTIRLLPNFDSATRFKNLPLAGRKITLSYNPNPDLPRALIYHDSFFFSIIPFLSEHFSRGVYIQNYIAGDLWNLSWIDEEKPDVVILEFTERAIEDIPVLLENR